MLSSPPSPSHCRHVMQQLCAQLEFGFLCDVIVRVGEVHFRAHRAVLAACSGFFHKLFVTQPVLAERTHCSYALSSSAVSPQHFDAILQMMYQGPRGEGGHTDPELGAAMAFLEFYDAPPAWLKARENGREQGLLYGVESRRPEGEGEGEMEEGEVVGQSLAVQALDQDWKPGFLYSSSAEKMQRRKGEEGEVDGKAEEGKNHSFSSFCSSPLSSSCSSSTSCSDSPSLPRSPSPSRAPAPLKNEVPESPAFLALHGIKVVQVSSEAGARAASTGTASQSGYLPELPLIIQSNPELASSPKAVTAGAGGSRQWAWAGKSMLLKTEEGGSLSPLPKPALTPLSPPRPRMPSTFPCSRCELSFDTSQGLEEHLLGCGRKRPARRRRVPRKLQHSPSPPFQTLPRPIKQEPCSVEVEVELEVDGLPPAPDQHTPEQSCRTCGKHFKRVKMLQTHRPRCPMLLQSVGRPRSEDRNHVCRTCGKAFLQRGHLTEHEATHSQVKRFSCSHCGKQFVRRRELKVHEARHEGQASYHCQFCGHASYRKNGHYHHLTTHLLPPQAICQACFQICENPTQLLEHEMEHRHTCERCGAKYRLKKELILHYMDCQGLTEDWP
ncbi:zinc finger and BTB domain-containing protein 18-like [Acipenser oxyrinchus oxyrinchus]|uniref:Zinc finger and BTB domain-containing protein 18-like n=1 Tax=Acipenser oxyrinchus oxyrinchus TaxID=40147 RepID=A0AAD8FV13_ACIOX|nr:zinc finger and BTB domain-containing protein 18-like [Acipenser oxyrinchus oxyrinchus]